MSKSTAKQFYPKNESAWREWLEKKHQVKDSVWLIFYKKSSPKYNISWSEAVDQALCYGWIDSVKRKLDEERFEQYFTKRKPKSTWSKVNKDKIENLKRAGLMKEAGLKIIEIAKENGSWNILDSVDNLIVPDDLEEVFNANPKAREYFLALSNSNKRGVLYRLISAKRRETREKRILEIIDQLSPGRIL